MPKSKDPRVEVMAERARAIVNEVGSIAEAARIGGVSVNTVSRMCAGSNESGVVAAAAFARGHGVTVEYLLGYTDEKARFKSSAMAPVLAPVHTRGVIDIPVLDIRPEAGPGSSAAVIQAVGVLPFPVQFARKLAPTDAILASWRCSGESMMPTIVDGALIIINERDKKPRPFQAPSRKGARPVRGRDDIFVFFHHGVLRMKRLRDLGDEMWAIISDNIDENPIEFFRPGRDGALAIIGKVVWWDNRL